ncbi:MAG: ferric-dicitrate binding protein FerR (iron transport regulator), partial [Candidatus Krumholzibacteriia bacterium]
GVVGPIDFTLPTEPHDEPYNYAVNVHRGEFRIKTGPDFAGRQITMTTSEGQVEIIGTTIAVFKNDDVTCVCVLEGTASIGKDDEHMDPVPAGMRKVMFADGRDPVIIPIEPAHEASLIDFEKITAHIFD